MTWADFILDYHFNLSTGIRLPRGVQWLFPYSVEETRHCMTAFYQKYYRDKKKRVCLLGINPGRLGAGTTGIPFTDPIRLEQVCGIPNGFAKRQELSSVFVYDVIDAYGGCKPFYKKFYISSLCPLGFIKDNKNYNYYDDKTVLSRVEPLIIAHLKTQIASGLNTSRCLCLGQGKNFQYLASLNKEHGFFDEIIPLPHPRWVMQYRRKRTQEFVESYLAALT